MGLSSRNFCNSATSSLWKGSLFALLTCIVATLPGNTHAQQDQTAPSAFTTDFIKRPTTNDPSNNAPIGGGSGGGGGVNPGYMGAQVPIHPQVPTKPKQKQRVVLTPVKKVKALSPEELKAQRKAEKKAKVEAKKKARKKILEVLEWKLIMAETKYGIKEDEDDRFELISAYQAIIDQLCMPDLPTSLKYDGPSKKNKTCHKRIDELIELDPENPSALCARDGIDAATCRASYSKQISTSDPNTITRRQRRGINTNRYVQAHAHSTELDDLESKLRSEMLLKEERQEIERELKAAYTKILQDSCVDIKTTVMSREKLLGGGLHSSNNRKSHKNSNFLGHSKKEKKPKQRTFLPEDPGDKATRSKKGLRGGSKSLVPNREEQMEFQRLLKRFDAAASGEVAKEEPELPQEDFYRVRLLPVRCEGMITRMLRILPNSGLAICYRDGLFSPFCIDALRGEKEKAEALREQMKKAKRLNKPSKKKGKSKAAKKPTTASETDSAPEQSKPFVKKKNEPPGIHEF